MLTLVLLGLVSGLITGVSPCVLPMIPIVFVAGGTGDTGRAEGRAVWLRPAMIIVGIVVSFGSIALLGTLLLSLLGLPTDLLRWAGIVLLALVGLSLVFPQVAHIVEKPFARIPAWTPGDKRGVLGPLLMGIGLGTLYVPCAGPVLAAISVAGATAEIGWRTVVLTASFALGAAVPLAFFAMAGTSMAKRLAAYRQRQRAFRVGGGVVLLVMAVAIAVNAPAALQRAIPGYTASAERAIARQQSVLDAVAPGGPAPAGWASCADHQARLGTCGPAPELASAGPWLNTGDRPRSISGLRGSVVLIDFWTYSCINCQRDAPYVKRWDAAYRDAGLAVIGVHTPEFAFEHDPANVAAAVKAEGIGYPVVQDNDFAIWNAYRNRYWPAKYLIDATGTVRAMSFGEGQYAAMESAIRDLLRESAPAVALPAPVTAGADPERSTSVTPEVYLGAARGRTSYRGDGDLVAGRQQRFRLGAVQPVDTFGLDGVFDVRDEAVTAADRARVRVQTRGAKVFTVLSGHGSVTVHTGAGADRVIAVDGVPRLYPIVDGKPAPRTVELSLSPGISVYTFTFG